jgi:hypothetical protein
MTEASITRELYKGLSERPEPWQVSEKITSLLSLSEQDAARFPQRPYWMRDPMYKGWRSAMSSKFERPADMKDTADVLIAVARKAWPDFPLKPAKGDDPDDVAGLLASVRILMIMQEGKTSFKTDRLDRKERAKHPTLKDMSRRRYDKLFRLVGRLEKDIERFGVQSELADLTRFAKLGMAGEVPWSQFSASPATAAFVAYYAANLGRRSLFTAGKQARAFDSASEFLLERLEKDPKASWVAAAHVFPRTDVLTRLTPQERGDLLQRALQVMTRTAELLKATVTETMDIENLVVRRGDDSSTWNALAGAWNKARDLWIATSWTLDPTISDAFLPGKMLRLMAADVVAWHRRTNGLDPDTKVWQQLPRPWEVMSGEKACTREGVIRACQLVGVDPASSGWAKPRARTKVDVVRDTPQTVHGVVVSHPQLALILRKAGWFSGYDKRVREIAPELEAVGAAQRSAHAEAYGPPVAAESIPVEEY